MMPIIFLVLPVPAKNLNLAIKKALKDAGLSATDIDFISAHGTATIYNDEMEAKAITLADLQTVP